MVVLLNRCALYRDLHLSKPASSIGRICAYAGLSNMFFHREMRNSKIGSTHANMGVRSLHINSCTTCASYEKKSASPPRLHQRQELTNLEYITDIFEHRPLTLSDVVLEIIREFIHIQRDRLYIMSVSRNIS